MKNNARIVEAAVNQEGSALEYASEDLRNNARIVEAAVNHNGTALKYASKEIRNNETMVMAAVTAATQGGSTALEYANEDMKNNQAIVQAAAHWDREYLREVTAAKLKALHATGRSYRHLFPKRKKYQQASRR